jgi:hypothetical protein
VKVVELFPKKPTKLVLHLSNFSVILYDFFEIWSKHT